MSFIDIGVMKTENGNYHVCLEAHQSDSVMNFNIKMTREDLKEMRNSLHNALLELNMELNYEP